MSKFGICKLCLLQKGLRHLHIIPEFCYKPLYDLKHRVIEISLEDSLEENFDLQKGYREYLLCGDCENLISKHETYFSNTWYQQKKLPDRIADELLEVNGLDYAKFKLFHLSILWRADISSKFARVKLGHRHEETLRKMLLNGEPGPEDRYSFFTAVLTHDNDNIVHSLILKPVRRKSKDGHQIYVFTFGGCARYYFVSSHSTRNHLQFHFSHEGRLSLVKKKFYELNHIRGFAKTYHQKRLIP